jgi:hypothetical protein
LVEKSLNKTRIKCGKNNNGVFMTREEMKRLKEDKQILELIIKSNSKLYGYKTIAGFVYKIITDFVFIISIGINYEHKTIDVIIECKPMILDEIFWEIFNMDKEAKNKPLSFHVSGAFTARAVKIKNFELVYNNKEEIEIKFKEIINCSNIIIEKYNSNINNLDAFYENIKNDENQYLNIILMDIIRNNYREAIDKINDCIKEYKTGGFMENTKSIIEFAKEYCEKRI